MSEETPSESRSNYRLANIDSARIASSLLSDTPLNGKLPFFYNFSSSCDLLPDLNSQPMKSTAVALDFKKSGDEAFCSGFNDKALMFYTRSVAVALPDSQELAIAYAYRSAALYRLERYEACLVDINRALEGNYPEDLKPKLIARKTAGAAKLKDRNATKLNDLKSLEKSIPDDDTLLKYLKYQMKECEFDVDALDLDYREKFYLPSVNFQNEEVPNASEKLKIKFSPEMGLHVVAVEDIKPGEVLAIEEPFASILLFTNRYSHCSNCYVRCEAMIPCDNCSTVMFCSRQCRDNAMNRFHRAECSILINAVNFTEICEKDWLAVRLLLMATKQGEELEMLMQHSIYKDPFGDVSNSVPTTFDSNEFANMFNMINHLDKFPAERLVEMLKKAVVLLYILKSSSFFGASQAEHDWQLTEKELYAGNLLLRFLLSILYNIFNISEVSGDRTEDEILQLECDSEKIGFGLYAFNRLFNHACDHNVVNHFHKATNVSHAIKTIKTGEQLFVNYGMYFNQLNRMERRKLCCGYHFTCHCRACEADWPTMDREKFVESRELRKECHRLHDIFRDLEIPISGRLHSTILFKISCDALTSLLDRKINQPIKAYLTTCMYWQNQMIVFISARANFYESTRDRVLLSLV